MCEDFDPEDIMEIRLAGRQPDDSRSELSEGVVDVARPVLLMEAMDRRWDSGRGRVRTCLINSYDCTRVD